MQCRMTTCDTAKSRRALRGLLHPARLLSFRLAVNSSQDMRSPVVSTSSSMFKFGFGDPAGQDGAHAGAAATEAETAPPAEDNIGAEEVSVSEGKPAGSQETLLVSSQLSLFKGVVSNSQAVSLLADERLESNDLIAGVYEGGFKSWEGGVDLAQFVAAAIEQGRQSQDGAAGPPQLQLGPGSRVMELGCGHGLPGLVALWAGAEVHFQDYNRTVLTTLTIPNVAANVSAWATRRAAAAAGGSSGAATAASGAAAQRVRYFAGSWDALPALLQERGLQHSYDLVLTAETIYSVDAMRSLYRCIKACLKGGTGAAFVAAKSYYFGVGGGTTAFKQLVEADGLLQCETVAVIDDGLSNKREILCLTFKQP